MRMHKDEIEVNDEMVKKLISGQFPQFNSLHIKRVNSIGTVNVIYRLGEEYLIRLPILSIYSDSILDEFRVLPVIAKNVTLVVPEIIGKGRPSQEYPHNWAIYRWIHGNIINDSTVSEVNIANGLAGFINELRSIQILGNEPKAGRKPLRELVEITVKKIAECENDIDGERALKVWRELVDNPPWNGTPVWIHADLLKPNLIVNSGNLFAVIDFGSAGVGDPAFDVTPAWTVLSLRTRGLFRGLLNVDEHTWLRAKAYALHQAALIIPYYRKSNPNFVKQACDTIENIIND